MSNTPSNPEASGAGGSALGPDGRKTLVPLTVWLCADTTRRPNDQQGNASCPPLCRGIGRELASHLMNTCTRQGQVVAEAFTRDEDTLLAAAELERRAVACVTHFPLAQHIRTRLRAEAPADQLEHLSMRPCRADQMHQGLADHAGRVSLVIAAPPTAPSSHRDEADRRTTDCAHCPSERPAASEKELRGFITAAHHILRPGGVLALVTSPHRADGRLVDPASVLVRQAVRLGFRYVQHVIALRVPVEGDTLVVQTRPGDFAHIRSLGSPVPASVVSVHADVSLLVKQGGVGR